VGTIWKADGLGFRGPIKLLVLVKMWSRGVSLVMTWQTPLGYESVNTGDYFDQCCVVIWISNKFVGSSFFNYFVTKESWILVRWKKSKSKSKNCWSQLFQNPPTVFVKITNNELAILWLVIWFFQKNIECHTNDHPQEELATFWLHVREESGKS
jgi:hypothetical protein